MATSPAYVSGVGVSATIAVVADDGELRRRLLEVLSASGLSCGDPAAAGVLLLGCQAFRAVEATTVRELCLEHPDAAVLVVSRSEDAARVRRALEAGASGYVSVEEAAYALAPAIAAVAAGQLCLPPAYRRQIAKPTFTTREKQILGLVVMGMSNAEIGRKLYLAESTVKSHLSSAFSKLGVRSRNEASALILDPSSGLGPGILRISEELPGMRRLSLS